MPNRSPLVIALLAALAACGQKPDLGPATPAAADDLDDTIAPAIIPPDEVANPKEPPSYEVAIASAAANRNRALDRCMTQPEAVRTQCEQEANTAFAETQSKLQDLRGDKQ